MVFNDSLSLALIGLPKASQSSPHKKTQVALEICYCCCCLSSLWLVHSWEHFCDRDPGLNLLEMSFFYRCSLLILYTFFSNCITSPSYCRCDPPGTEHILYWYYRCDIPRNEDFLFTPHTLSSCCSCNPPDTVHSLYALHSLLLVLQMRPSWYFTLYLLILQM